LETRGWASGYAEQRLAAAAKAEQLSVPVGANVSFGLPAAFWLRGASMPALLVVPLVVFGALAAYISGLGALA
jgi:hypothetical protein